ncbi:hypothetical protein EGW08_015161 [Elysia chlorotica]|uniref:Acyl-coenzyme A oxidase n=1 Tax=Elysia chlorotica TaxID=188477 RepID=A0A3S0ZWK9_ELYCH|nr:hypothetical protein EGW08_015161 [Elysia chlorotica]
MAAPIFNTNTDALPVNPDLQKERASASFNVLELTHILDGGPEITKRRKELESLILSDPVFSNKDLLYLTKSEQYENAVLRSVKLVQWKNKYKWSPEDVAMAQRVNNSTEAITLHTDMFIPALQRLTSEEQREKWLPLALNHDIIGTYAQTELGHGTNLRNLETTATFDAATDEFVLNTPKITSMKWWPGALGKSSTHAIVLAQLVIAGNQHGLQAFIIQLRSLDDHSPLPGITVGDIGPKLGLNYVDNGFLILTNLRIPRENMLMGNASVSRDGQFKQLKSDKTNYSTMMYVRVLITKWAFGCLAGSAMIAMRYSAVRRQLYIDPKAEEVQILDYQTQQYKLFPALASAFAIFFTSQKLTSGYNQDLSSLIKGDKELLAEYHSVTSAMKAVCSDLMTDHIGTLRRSLGGHGYMMLSGLATVMLNSLTLVTVEGENTVLYQQTARHLLKQVARAMSGSVLTGSVAFLSKDLDNVPQLETPEDCRNVHLVLQLYQKMAKRVLIQAGTLVQTDLMQGLPEHEAWNKNQVTLVRAAKAYSLLQLVQCNVEGVDHLRTSASPGLVAALHRCCCLFALYYLNINAGLFMQTDSVSPSQLDTVRATEMQLLSEIRPDAVALADAIDLPDAGHKSVLGCYDGNVYERMYAAALGEPMNKSQVHPSYYKHLRGMIKGSTSKL